MGRTDRRQQATHSGRGGRSPHETRPPGPSHIRQNAGGDTAMKDYLYSGEKPEPDADDDE
ncbi:hypothetical protein Lfu02_73230 [Longispora fulva]|nr:hypothetical protein Lfu02_73230 [Longispora fulva]